MRKGNRTHELYLTLVGVGEDKHIKYNVNIMENIHIRNNLIFRSPEICDTGLRKCYCMNRGPLELFST